jgi:hypothetical protein
MFDLEKESIIDDLIKKNIEKSKRCGEEMKLIQKEFFLLMKQKEYIGNIALKKIDYLTKLYGYFKEILDIEGLHIDTKREDIYIPAVFIAYCVEVRTHTIESADLIVSIADTLDKVKQDGLDFGFIADEFGIEEKELDEYYEIYGG